MGCVTELSFLIDLLLNHKLSPKTKEAISVRIKDVEANLSSGNSHHVSPLRSVVHSPAVSALSGGAPQAASTIAALERHAAMAPPVPVAEIAQTPLAQAAMEKRKKLLSQGNKPEEGRTGPKKF